MINLAYFMSKINFSAMKSIAITYLFPFVVIGFLSTYPIEVTFEKESKVAIKGTSNVNSFTCEYQDEIKLQQKTINVETNRKEKFNIKKAKLHLFANNFDCGGRRINKDFRALLQTDKFPYIDIYVHGISFLEKEYVADVEVSIAGKNNNYKLKVENPEKNHFTGDLIIDISDFGLESPKKLMGLIEVNNLIDINFDVYLSLKN